MEVKINAEGLVVGPDEILIIHLPADIGLDHEGLDVLMKDFRTVLGDRFLIYVGEAEFTKVQRKPSPGIAADYADSAE